MVHLTVRWLDAADQVLAWTTVTARIPGDGTLRAGPVSGVVDRAGTVVCCHVHWADLHVQTRVPASADVMVGDHLTAQWDDDMVLRLDDPARHPPVPPVVVRAPVRMSIQSGALGL